MKIAAQLYALAAAGWCFVAAGACTSTAARPTQTEMFTPTPTCAPRVDVVVELPGWPDAHSLWIDGADVLDDFAAGTSACWTGSYSSGTVHAWEARGYDSTTWNWTIYASGYVTAGCGRTTTGGCR